MLADGEFQAPSADQDVVRVQQLISERVAVLWAKIVLVDQISFLTGDYTVLVQGAKPAISGTSLLRADISSWIRLGIILPLPSEQLSTDRRQETEDSGRPSRN